MALLAQTPEQEIENLKNDSYVVREVACEKLLKLGETARPALKQALASESSEVKLRAAEIIKTLDVEAIWGSSKVTYIGNYNESLLEESFNAAGNTIDLNNTVLQHLELRKLSPNFNYQTVPFWEALDDFCLKTNTHYYNNFHNDQKKEFSVGYRKQPRAYSGSFKISLQSAVRRFSEEYDYSGKSEITHDFKIKMQSEWEYHANILAYKNPIIIKAEVGGNNYAIGSKETLWHPLNANRTRTIGADVMVRPIPSSAKKIDLLHVKWEFFASTGPKKLDLDIEDGKIEDDNLEVNIRKLEVDSTVYVLDMDFQSDYLFVDNTNSFSSVIDVKMFDKEDKEFPLHSQGFNLEGGILKYNGRFLKNETNEPFRLQITYDSLYSTRELDFIFKDVAFPSKNW